MRTMTEQYEILDAIDTNGLHYKQVTESLTGYPEPITGIFVYGFETFEDAENFAGKHIAEVNYGYWKNGWQLCNVRGRAFKPFTVTDYISELGDDYSIAIECDVNNFIYEHLKELAESQASLDKIEDFIEVQKEVLSKLYDSNADTETVITYCNAYYETVNDILIHYHSDVHNNHIGVYIPYNND